MFCNQYDLPKELIQRIASHHGNVFGVGMDKQIWEHTSYGQFSVKTTYELFFYGDEWLILHGILYGY